MAALGYMPDACTSCLACVLVWLVALAFQQPPHSHSYTHITPAHPPRSRFAELRLPSVVCWSLFCACAAGILEGLCHVLNLHDEAASLRPCELRCHCPYAAMHHSSPYMACDPLQVLMSQS